MGKTIGKRQAAAIFLFIIYICAVVYCCFGHFNDLPQVGQEDLWGIPMDKVVHFIMFFPFPMLCYPAFCHRNLKVWKTALNITVILVIGCALAAGTEIGQSMTDYRSGDPMDFLADFAALAASSVITFIFEILTSKKLC